MKVHSSFAFALVAFLGTVLSPTAVRAEARATSTTAPAPTAVPVPEDATPSTAPKPLSDALTGDAQVEYEAAKLLFSDGDLPGAATKFRRAYDLSKDPRLLWNIAVCEKEQRHYAKASSLVTQYLAEGVSMLAVDSRVQAEETLQSLRQFSSEVVFQNVPDGAKVLVDGGEVGTTPLGTPLFLDLGEHKLEVRVAGFLPFQTMLNVPGEKRLEVPVKLEKDTSSARLIVTTTQPKSVITVDGRVRGSDRWESGLAPGKHQVRVTAPGKQDYEVNVELAAQSSRTMEVTLKDKKRSPWPWIAGGAAVVAGATVGAIFLFRENTAEVAGPEGDLDTIPLRFPGGF